MTLAKYKFNAGEKWPAENANSINPNEVNLLGKLTSGANYSILSKWLTVATVADETKTAEATTVGNAYGIYSDNWKAQTFFAVKKYLLGIKVRLQNAGNPTANLTVSIWATDVNGKPTGSALKSFTVDKRALSYGLTDYTIDLEKFEMTIGNKYAIVFNSATTGANDIKILYNNSAGEISGELLASSNAGSTWSGSGYDLTCAIYQADTPDLFPAFSANINNTLYSDLRLNLVYGANDFTIGAESLSDAFSVYGSNIRTGNTFISYNINSITKVLVKLRRYGTPTGNVTVEIFATSGGLPTGSALGSATVDVATISNADLVDVTFTFATPVTIDLGTSYAFVVSFANGNSSNYVNAGGQGSNIYPAGDFISYNGSWSANTGYEMYFKIAGRSVVTMASLITSLQNAVRIATSGTESVAMTDNKIVIESEHDILQLISPSAGLDVSGNISDGASKYYLDLADNAVQSVINVLPDYLVRLDDEKQIPAEILTRATAVKVSQGSRGFADASSVVTIAHNLGKLPKAVQIMARHTIPNSNSTYEGNTTLTSDGYSNGTDNICSYVVHTAIGSNPYYPRTGDGNSATNAIYMRKMLSGDSYQNSYILQTATITFDETNIYINFTKASGGQTPASVTGTFYYSLMIL